MLLNLTPACRTAFKIPQVEMPVTFYPEKGEDTEQLAIADTLTIEPDAKRFTVVWRTALPLKRNMREIGLIVAGRMTLGWYRARKLGKTWYPSLGALIAEKKGDSAPANNVEVLT